MFGVFAGFGMGLTATKHVAELRQTDPARAGRLIGLSGWVAWLAGGMMTLALMLAAGPIAAAVLGAPHLAPYLRACAPLLLLGSLNGAQVGALAGFEAFKQLAQLNALSGVVSFPLLAAGAWLLDLEGAAYALVLGSLFTWLINGLALRREAHRAGVPVTHRLHLSEARVLWEFSLPSAVSNALMMPVNWLCAAILVNQPGGYGEMGIFNVANQWRGFVMLVPNTLIGLSLPILSNLAGQSDEAGHRRVSSATSRINVGVTALLAVGVGLAAPWILKAYGSAFEGGVLCVWLLAVSAAPGAYCWAKYQVLASHGRMWTNVWMLAAWAASLIVLTAVLVPWWQSKGLALANLLAQLFYAATLAIYLRRLEHKRPEEEDASSSESLCPGAGRRRHLHEVIG